MIIKEDELLKNGELKAQFNPGTESKNDVQCEEPKKFREVTPDLLAKATKKLILQKNENLKLLQNQILDLKNDVEQG